MQVQSFDKKLSVITVAVGIFLLIGGLGTEGSPGILTANYWAIALSAAALIVLTIVFGFLVTSKDLFPPLRHSAPLSLAPGLAVPGILWILSLITEYLFPFSFPPFFFWACSIIAFFVVAYPNLKASTPHVAIWEILVLLPILSVGIFFRFWQLPELPFQYDGDNASVGLAAIEILTGQETRWLGPGWGQMPLSYIRIWSSGMQLFGADLNGLATSLSLSGILGIVAVWIFARVFADRLAALFAALFCAASFAHIHFSRALYIEPASIILTLIMLFFVLWLRKRETLYLLLAGVCSGVALTFYESARVNLPIIFTTLGLMTLSRSLSIKKSLQCFSFFLIGLLIGWGPNSVIAISDLQEFTGRAGTVTIFSPTVSSHLQEKFRVDSLGMMMVEQFKRAFLGFTYFTDTSPHAGFPRPLLEWPLAGFAFLGVGLCLRRIRTPDYYIPLLWIAFVAIFGGALTVDPPYWPHIIAALPIWVTLGGIGTSILFREIAAGTSATYRAVFLGALATLLAFGAHVTWQEYTTITASTRDVYSIIYRYLAQVPAGTRVIIALENVDWRDRRFAYNAPHIQGGSTLPQDLQAASLIPGTIIFAEARQEIEIIDKFKAEQVKNFSKISWPESSPNLDVYTIIK